MLEAVARGATRITVLGALGGPRLDHALANVGLLAMPPLGDLPTALLDARARIRLITAPGPGEPRYAARCRGRLGSRLAAPLGEGVAGVTTDGFRYPLHDEPLRTGPARGLSNVRSSQDAAVVVRRGRLLVIDTPATLVA